MWLIQKLIIRLSMIFTIMLVTYHNTQGKNKPISLQEAIEMALKNNLTIQITENKRKLSTLSNRIDTFRLWTPQVAFHISQQNHWKSKGKFYPQRNGYHTTHTIQATPLFTLKWELAALSDKIFQTKINCQEHSFKKLDAKKSVEKELEQVVHGYYELALAQKKWELSNNLIKIATARLKIEEEKLRLGLISKIDCLDAQLAVKQVKLTLLERQEVLKGKCRRLNLLLGKALNEETLVESNISIQPIWDMNAVTKEKVADLDTAIKEKKVAIAATKLQQAKAYPLACLSLAADFKSNKYLYDLKNKQYHRNEETSQWSANIGINIDIAALLLMPAKIKQARIALDNAKFELTQQKLSIEGGLEDKKWQYHHALGAHKVVEAQLKISKQKLRFVREKYRLNQVKLLELHEAEEATQKVEIDLIEHAFKVKKAEFDLHRMVGMFHQ